MADEPSLVLAIEQALAPAGVFLMAVLALWWLVQLRGFAVAVIVILVKRVFVEAEIGKKVIDIQFCSGLV